MPARRSKPKRDVDKNCSQKRFVATLRRIAAAIEQGKRLRIQVAGERVSIPPDAAISIEHEREGTEEEIELQLRW